MNEPGLVVRRAPCPTHSQRTRMNGPPATACVRWLRSRLVPCPSGRHKKLAPLWQKRYYDRNVRNYREFTVKLRYLHRNPVRRGLIGDAADWKWSSFRHYVFRERAWWKLSRSGQRGTVNDRKKRGCSSAQVSVHRTDANLGHPARSMGKSESRVQRERGVASGQAGLVGGKEPNIPKVFRRSLQCLCQVKRKRALPGCNHAEG